MIKYKDIILEDYFIDPVTAIITNSKGEIQETTIHKNGRPCFKRHAVHQWQVHTHIGYKQGYDIHHLDENKMNNSLSNLVYLKRSEHAKIHHKGEKNPLYGKYHSEEAKRKISESHKGKKNGMYGKRYKWINNGIENRYIPLDEDIPAGFSRGRLKK